MLRLALFVIVFLLQTLPAQARVLNAQEQLSLINYEKSVTVMNYMIQEIDPRLLTFRQRLNFQVSRLACAPVKQLVDQIQAAQEMEDQSQNLLMLMYGCLSGVVNVTDLYRLQSI
jgi:hypothetical protein